MEQPQQITQQDVPQIKYAGFWIRWVAAVIDGIVLFIPNIILGAIIGFTVLPDQITDAALMSPISVVLPYVSGTLLGWIYYIAMTSKYQATLGKRAVGIVVISAKGPVLTLGQIIVRETIGKLISGVILGLGYLMAAFSGKKQALHDKMGSTLVVYRDPNKKTTGWVIVVVIISVFLVMAAIVGILASITLVSVGSAREKGRDARRVFDAQSIVLALDLYKAAFLTATPSITWQAPRTMWWGLPSKARMPCLTTTSTARSADKTAVMRPTCTAYAPVYKTTSDSYYTTKPGNARLCVCNDLRV